jgi:hypothetical protein
MNDFEAPQLRDTDPPRMFATVRAARVQYDMDSVQYLMNQEINRLREQRLPPMSNNVADMFHKELIRLLIIHQNPVAAIELRSTTMSHQ